MTTIFSAISAAQEPQRANYQPSIVVTGEGEAYAKPDLAVVNLGAVAQAPDAATAQNNVNEIMNRTIEAIKQAGIPETHIKTAGLSLTPVYTHDEPRPGVQPEPRITGYRASNGVEVRIEDITRTSTVIDSGIKAGANDLQGVWLTLKDDSKQREEAIASAIRKARAKATAMASALGVELGSIHQASEEINGFPRPMARMEAMMSTPIQPGQSQVTARVTLTYNIGAEKK